MNALFTDEVLIRSLLLFLMVGSVAGLFIGVAMLLQPEWLQRVSKYANLWISTRKLARPLARSFDLEAWLYRYNRVAGVLLLSAAVYIIYYLTADFDKKIALKSVFHGTGISPLLMDGLLDGMVLFGLVAAVFAVIISLYLCFRPSMMRDFEQLSNKRTSLRQVLKPWESLRNSVDIFVFKNIRLAGVLIITGSFYALVILLSYWKNT